MQKCRCLTGYRDAFGLARNNYDKLGHFAQGFIPAMVAREILLRKDVINGRAWLNFLVVCFCLAVSAFYELVEWAVAEIVGGPAEAFLGYTGLYLGYTVRHGLCADRCYCCVTAAG